MTQPRDYYEVLGTARDASADEIRRAYRRLARQFHPDVNKAADAATRFAEVQAAYEVLSDADKRKAYDRLGHAGVGRGVGHAPGGFNWSSSGPGGSGFGGPDFSSVFQDIFGRSAGGQGPEAGFGGAGTASVQPGTDSHEEVTVTFLTAARGGVENLRIETSRGVESIEVKIPPAVQDGAQLRVRGKGQPGIGGGPNGDLILRIRVGGHPYFRRENLDLLLDVPITVAEAATGVTVTVPLLRGTVEIKIPPGASSGQKLRVRGKGLSDTTGRSGDFFGVVSIVAPAPLTDRVKEHLQALAGELQNPRESAPWSNDV